MMNKLDSAAAFFIRKHSTWGQRQECYRNVPTEHAYKARDDFSATLSQTVERGRNP
jgi:hypothetical protein